MSVNSKVSTSPHKVVLPDLPGIVHGIKSAGPDWSVQCDDCLTVFRGTWLLTVAQSAIFNTRATGAEQGLRLCAGCWQARGWEENHKGWVSQ